MISEELKNCNVSIKIHRIRKQIVTTEHLWAIIEKEEKKLKYSSISFSLQVKFPKRFMSRQTFVNMQKPVLIRNELPQGVGNVFTGNARDVRRSH